MNTQNTYVLYHRDPVKGFCLDGLGAYYAAYHHFGDNAEYIPVTYNTPFPLDDVAIENSDIYILDFSYSREILEHVNSLANRLVVLDHHKTAKSNLEGFDPGGSSHIEFDMKSSGCRMAWRYFNPDSACPQLLNHIEDYDLWKYDLQCTKEIIHGLTYKLNEITNDKKRILTFSSLNISLSELYNIGSIIISNIRHNHRKIIESGNIVICEFEGYRVGLYNCNEHVSEMGEAIYNSATLHVDFAMMYSVLPDNTVVFSLRSKKHKDGLSIDVGEIAKTRGGGGHENASGFTLPLVNGFNLLSELLRFNRLK